MSIHQFHINISVRTDQYYLILKYFKCIILNSISVFYHFDSWQVEILRKSFPIYFCDESQNFLCLFEFTFDQQPSWRFINKSIKRNMDVILLSKAT